MLLCDCRLTSLFVDFGGELDVAGITSDEIWARCASKESLNLLEEPIRLSVVSCWFRLQVSHMLADRFIKLFKT